MPGLIRLRNLTHGYGPHPLIKEGSAVIDKGDKLCLLGRNGMGKSTLLKIIAGEIDPDQGIIEKESGLKISLLAQSVPAHSDQSVFDIVADQNEIPAYEIERVLSKLHLDPYAIFSTLSGGQKRRAALAQALVQKPDVLLLDEPTNHLDIESIEWLETFLKNDRGTLILVSHDRALMESVGNCFLEIDHGKLISFRGSYHDFLNHKEHVQLTEANAQAAFDKKLSQEEVWIRQGIKARRTRNEGRVRALKKMREEFNQRQQKLGKIKLSEQITLMSGKEVFVMDDVSFAYGDKKIIQNFSTIISRGDKIGILGANGTGKSTLIQLLLKTLEPSHGTLTQGTNLNIVYFDQHRQQLNLEKSIFDNVCEGSDYIELAGQRVHIMRYLQDFLFTPDRIRTPVKALSGGERNRIMLAKLFMKPANVLILDEPTNDLDIETLELLEEQLIQFKGTVILVSHDRSFINHIVSSTLVFEAGGKLQAYAGGYDDWLIQRKNTPVKESIKDKKPSSKKASIVPLNYKEKRELEQLPAEIEQHEALVQALSNELSDPSFYQNSPDKIQQKNQEMQLLAKKLEHLYARWQSLEEKL